MQSRLTPCPHLWQDGGAALQIQPCQLAVVGVNQSSLAIQLSQHRGARAAQAAGRHALHHAGKVGRQAGRLLAAQQRRQRYLHAAGARGACGRAEGSGEPELPVTARWPTGQNEKPGRHADRCHMQPGAAGLATHTAHSTACPAGSPSSSVLFCATHEPSCSRMLLGRLSGVHCRHEKDRPGAIKGMRGQMGARFVALCSGMHATVHQSW